MEILTTVAGKVAEYTVEPIIRQGGYIIHCKSNLHTLKTRVDELKATRGRMHNDIVAAERKGEIIQPDVVLWMTESDEITGKAEELLNDDQAKMKCLLGFCPNLLTRHQLSRKSTKLVEVVVELNGKGVFPSISIGGRAEEVFLKSTKVPEAFDSRNLTIKGIIDELSNPDTNKIGVYGIGGVGKTTLVEEVVRRVMEDKLFDDVVMVRDVKENPDIGRIQKEIAEKLDMDSNALESRSIADKARRICGRISNKNTLIVLDDIWSYVDLKAVGLPDVATCKVLLTSRIKELLYNKMGTQKNFQLANLEENECWQLFESKAGEVVRDQRIRTVAAQVANRCGGLPILVVTVASALKESTLPEWRNALKRLKKFEKKGSAEQAFLALEWSYDRLDDEGLKPLFLLCGVIAWKNSIRLEDLLKLAMGLGLLKNIDTVEEARDLLLSLVKKLKGFCLLLDTNSDTAVRMHDLVIDVADNIASRDGRFLSVACGAELENWTDEGLFGKCSKISIKSDSLAKLSEVLEFQKLEMFHLRCEDKYRLQVPNSFFANMEKLRVLSLINVKNLASLGFLKNLQILCLDQCEMEDIAVVGELSKLEILSLGNSNITELPKEIGELTCLRLLDLTWCYSLQVIAPNVLSRLTRLEDLRMRYSPIKWEAEHEGERSNASLLELKHLSLLTALEIKISNPDMLPKGLFSDKLERFHICIGNHPWSLRRSMNTLKLQFTSGEELDQGLKTMVKRSEDLTLQGGANVNEIAYQLEGDNFRQVKHLQLRELDITFIINSKVVFSGLTTLKVIDCHGIKFLFSSSMARSVVQLKTLYISGCGSMVEIVSTQEDNGENNIVNMFSRLEFLTLRELPSLVGFCSRSYAGFSSLEEALISNGQSKGATITKEIEDGDSKDHLGVDNAVHYFLFDEKVVFSSLTTLNVDGCHGIKFLFSSSMARSLVQLKTLEIHNCRSMVEIVSTQEDDEKNNIVNMFSKLESLTLRELPSFVGFCSGSYAGFSSLEEALISNCQSKSTTITKEIEDGDSKDHLGVDNAVHYFLFDEKVTFPSLEILWLEKLPKLEAVWQNQLAPDSFCRIREVRVDNCPSLINLFVPCITERLDALKTLRVWSCPALEVAFKCRGLKFKETHDPSTKELKTFNCCPNLEYFSIQRSDKLKYIFQTEERLETVPKFVFPKVTKLLLSNLPQFKSIYPGTHVSQWPSLQELYVDECGEVKIIAGELSVYQEKQESASHSNPIEQPLILIEKGSSLFPSMETWTLGAIEMWSGPPPAQVFSKVKLVEVRGATFSKHAAFLQRLHNLEKIIVKDMGDKDPCREIFVDAGNSGGEIQVKKLTIRDMNELMHIGKESSQSAVPVFPKLERLRVSDCSRLKNLDSSTISFQNLTSLTVDSLDGLKYLVSHRIARSLMQLTRLKIRYCKRMEVIVATEEDDDELAFSQLKHLEFFVVPHLRGLGSGNCILKFPSLETLKISRRLKSKLFSHDEIRCKIDYDTYDTDVEDAPADDEDGSDHNEVNDDGHGKDKKDDKDSACDANVC
ncbi:disease resistance protein At4g27190-like isoform X1 [Rosa rugosa]|uniref:disease resistance protein At4g27190-like isoform X1 n=1 Tax=Rosa rugosa TaxID=74645 RepID=UPI002B40B561|nr:disease resistance protein At4g27190-like isoform X1 [Rosa rugosa]XP_062005050.1 disease resistance protein At4g27190-like isoform X1 [Rosa rugosa]